MHRMFTDIALSSEMNSEFKKIKSNSFDLNVSVLTMGSWPLPIDTTSSLKIPIEVINFGLIHRFKND